MGVSHPWAVWALDHGAPTDREALMSVARTLDATGIAPEFASPGDAAVVLPVLESAMQAAGIGSQLSTAIGRIADWYHDSYG